MVRPLATIGFTAFAALWIATAAGSAAVPWLAVAFLMLFLVALPFRALRRRPDVLAALLTAAAAFCGFSIHSAQVVAPLQAMDGQTAVLCVRVEEIASSGRTVVSVRDCDPPGCIPVGSRLTAYWADPDAQIEPYALVTGKFSLNKPAGIQSERYARTRGIYLSARPEGIPGDGLTVQPPAGKPWYAWPALMRERAEHSIRSLIAGDAGALIGGICFGDKHALSDQAEEDFRASGVSHLLAVSGLHLAVIAQALLAFLRFIRVPRRLSSTITAACVLFFMALTGFSVSVMRAGIMTIVLMAGQIFRREADSLNSLGAAVLLLVLPNPYAVLDVGLQLSFAATLGLLVIQPRLAAGVVKPLAEKLDKHGGPSALRPVLIQTIRMVCVTLSATIPLLPIVAATFGELSLIAPVTNLVTVFPATVVLLTGCLGALLLPVPVLGLAAKGLLLAAGLISRYLLGATQTLGSIPFATIPVRDAYLFVWITGAILLTAIGWKLLRGKGVRRALAMAAVVLVCCQLLHGFYERDVVSVVVADSGDSTVALLERDGHYGLIVYGSDRYAASDAQYLLNNRGVRRLDFLLLPDLDGEAAANMYKLADDIAVDMWIYPPQGKYLTPVRQAAKGMQTLILGNEPVLFWDGECAQWYGGGWLRVTTGSTRLLLCHGGGSVSVLPEEWRQADLAIWSGTPPKGMELLDIRAGAWSCRASTAEEAAPSLPWDRYPIVMTPDIGDVTIKTRRQGDLTLYTGRM